VVFQKFKPRGVEILVENQFVTSATLNRHTEKIVSEMHRQKSEMMQWITGILIAQGAAIVALQSLIG
jgi:hypothetical protein